jgi:hypothetical protein
VVAVKTNIERLRPLVSPEGKEVIKELETSVNNYETQVFEQSKALAKAQDESVYWSTKHHQTLSKLWWWRGLAIAAFAGVALYIGLKTSWRFFL